ncbi:MAG: Pimeloyl-ACP methyl ester carboxylesterase [Hydrocarboniphaga sp.]|uniref:alpha/beta fold hydrolase n=1 Tax=Hydrocarboniphaga sp. TaxID=2033016 RepID=UPI002636E8ED|nr:alpha/beta hydrolase [Hydrocarboniphaga sp.]MDB5971483.1 Pimeloyl-ACP methyl ester carboxylesterase [Hydrocarboniphaga sp.]
MSDPQQTPRKIRVAGIDLAYLERGSGPLVICQHGFPDTAWSFVPVLDRLAAAGFRAVAPFLRGYAPSGLAPDGRYDILSLSGDLVGLVEALGGGPAFAVGHDWGSVAVQGAARSHPEMFKRIVLCAVPHLRRFFLGITPRQIARSHYMLRFQLPLWPEARLLRDDFAWMEEVLIRRWSPGWHYTAEDLAPLKAGLREPARLEAALAYYRSIPGLLVNPAALRRAFSPIPVPTRMIYGSDDGCIGAEMFDGQEPLFPNGLDLCLAPGMGHFMQAERPDWFADRVIEYCAMNPESAMGLARSGTWNAEPRRI